MLSVQASSGLLVGSMSYAQLNLSQFASSRGISVPSVACGAVKGGL